MGVQDPVNVLDCRFIDRLPNNMYTGHAALFPPKFVSLVLSEARRMGITVDPIVNFA